MLLYEILACTIHGISSVSDTQDYFKYIKRTWGESY